MSNDLTKELRPVSYVQQLLDRDPKYITKKVLLYNSISTKKFSKRSKKILCSHYKNCFNMSIAKSNNKNKMLNKN